MAYTVEQIDTSEKVVDGRFTGSTGAKNQFTRGMIFEGGDIVSTSFGYSPAFTPTNEQLIVGTNVGTEITTCFEGPLVKLWWDSEGKEHLSTTNKLDCRNSHWGNKEEKFGELFYNNGGMKFLEDCKDRELTHHFMIMTPSLMVTSEINLKDNDCMIVYLGSMSKQGYFSNIEFSEDVFYRQVVNSIPQKEELGGKILFPFIWKVDNVAYYANFIKQILTYGYDHNPTIVEELTQDEKFIGVDRRVIDSYFGAPVIIRTEQGIIKYIPSSYQKKCDILGNSPNINLLVFKMMDSCRPKQDAVLEYFENNDFLFVPEWDFLDSLKSSKNAKFDIIKKYRELGTVGFMDAKNYKNNDTRERNLLLVLLLCLPQSKVGEAIDGYKNYIACQNKIRDFISGNLTKIVEGKYDESLQNEKVIKRLKDICARSSCYALKGGQQTYNQKLQFSLKGLLTNEHGASLYKINKAISKFI